MTDATPTLLLPTPLALIRAALDGPAPAFLERYASTPPQAGATVLATFDLSVRLLAYSGRGMRLEVDGERHSPGEHLALEVGKLVLERRADEALELFLRGAGTDGQLGAGVLMGALGVLGTVLRTDDEHPGD